jgi:hypothetical protein
MKYILNKRIIPMTALLFSLQPQMVWSAATATVPALPKTGCTLATLAGNYIWDETAQTSFADQGYPIDGGWVFAVSVGREHNDGKGHITAGQLIENNSFNNPDNNQTTVLPYYGTVTVNADCTGVYHITEVVPDGNGGYTTADGGGGPIWIDPKNGNFTLLDAHNIGTARFVKDHQ